jgi:hypothetical protein
LDCNRNRKLTDDLTVYNPPREPHPNQIAQRAVGATIPSLRYRNASDSGDGPAGYA